MTDRPPTDDTRARAAIGELESGHRRKAEGDVAAAVRHFAEALRLSPYWREPFKALSELGHAGRAYEIARAFMKPGVSAAARTAGGTLAIFTVSSNNYAAHARALLDSVATHYPEAQRFHIVVDRDLLAATDYSAGCHPVRASEIGIPDFDVMAFRYDVTELNTAVKPFAFRHLFEVERFGTVLYFDPDVLVYRRSQSILDALAGGASAALTPHFTTPPAAFDEPNDQTMLRSGAYNLGFMGMRNSEEGERLLTWWSRHLQFNCRDRQQRGLFVDQRFLDLAPGYFERLHICRSEGANVAYWNLAERPLSDGGVGLRVRGVPLEFFHFSGCDPRDPGRLSRYTRRFPANSHPLLASLIGDYTATLRRNGFERFAALPYSYDVFRSGRPIPKSLRADFADHVLLWEEDPFATAETFVEGGLPAPRSRGHRGPPWWDRMRAERPATLRAFGPALLNLGLGYYHERRRNFADAVRRYERSLALRPDWHLPFRQLAALGEGERAYEIGRRCLEPGQTAAARTSGGLRAIFTIATNADMARARALLDSAERHDPEARRFLFIVDRETLPAEDLPPGVHVINTREIGIPGFDVMAFRYDRVELSAMVKPFAFSHLFEVEQFETAIFFAPDTLVLGASKPALDALARGASVVLTPLFTTPPTTSIGSTKEFAALRRGAWNVGFIAARRCEETARFLNWWAGFLQFKALRRPDAGLYLDSKPLDLALGNFEHIHIWRSAGASVEASNLAERPLTRTATGLHAGGAPLEFIRFDDWDEPSATRSAGHLCVSSADPFGVFDELAARYARLLDELDHARISRLPYSYDFFLSGRKIPNAVRAQAADRILYLGYHPFE
jgi:hypothetical protein